MPGGNFEKLVKAHKPPDDISTQNAHTYALRYHLQLAERLGSGIHGIVYVAERNTKPGKSEIKAHRSAEPYFREVEVYPRLQEVKINRILGHHVPQLIASDDRLRVLEMNIVAKPFVRDFAGAHLDRRPQFPAEIWEAWENNKKDQFEARWPKVLAILAALEQIGIYVVDVSPGNIAFLD